MKGENDEKRSGGGKTWFLGALLTPAGGIQTKSPQN